MHAGLQSLWYSLGLFLPFVDLLSFSGALLSNTTGSNTANGTFALFSNTTGSLQHGRR